MTEVVDVDGGILNQGLGAEIKAMDFKKILSE